MSALRRMCVSVVERSQHARPGTDQGVDVATAGEPCSDSRDESTSQEELMDVATKIGPLDE